MAGFDLIPVIDLKDGMVVHAREGRREEYRPVESRLAGGADRRKSWQRCWRSMHSARCTLPTWMRSSVVGDNLESIRAIRRNFPDLDLWTDTGIGDDRALERWLDAALGQPVIGSESLLDAEFMTLVRDRCADVFSGTFPGLPGRRFHGPAGIADASGTPLAATHPGDEPAAGRQRQGTGSRLDRRAGQASSPGCKVYAAGGVRSIEDLERHAATGAAGALIATALHDGRIGSAELSACTRLEDSRADGSG